MNMYICAYVYMCIHNVRTENMASLHHMESHHFIFIVVDVCMSAYI